MTTTIVAPNDVDPKSEHYAKVEADYNNTDICEIRAIRYGEVWLAVEGSHRLAIAADYGICPDIVDVTDEEIVGGLDLDDQAIWTRDNLRAYLERDINRSPIYTFED